jgi:hypothetical protein
MHKLILTLAMIAFAGLAQAQEYKVVETTTLSHGIDSYGHSFGVRTDYKTTTYMGQTKRDSVTKTTTRIPGQPDSVVYVTKIGEWPKPEVKKDFKQVQSAPVAPTAPKASHQEIIDGQEVTVLPQ